MASLHFNGGYHCLLLLLQWFDTQTECSHAIIVPARHLTDEVWRVKKKKINNPLCFLPPDLNMQLTDTCVHVIDSSIKRGDRKIRHCLTWCLKTCWHESMQGVRAGSKVFTVLCKHIFFQNVSENFLVWKMQSWCKQSPFWLMSGAPCAGFLLLSAASDLQPT